MNPIYVKLNHLNRLLEDLGRTLQLQTPELLGELNARLYDLNSIVEHQFQNYIPQRQPQFILQPEFPTTTTTARYHNNYHRHPRYSRLQIPSIAQQMPLNSHPRPTGRYWTGPPPTNRPQFIRDQYRMNDFPPTNFHSPLDMTVEWVTNNNSTLIEDLPTTFTNLLSQIMGINIDEELDQLQQQMDNQESVPIPLTDEYLKRIPVKRWKKKKPSAHANNHDRSSSETEDPCAICFDSFKRNQHVRNLPCEHTFHRKCIHRWFSEKTTRPICRRDMRDLLLQQQQQRTTAPTTGVNV